MRRGPPEREWGAESWSNVLVVRSDSRGAVPGGVVNHTLRETLAERKSRRERAEPGGEALVREGVPSDGGRSSGFEPTHARLPIDASCGLDSGEMGNVEVAMGDRLVTAARPRRFFTAFPILSIRESESLGHRSRF